RHPAGPVSQRQPEAGAGRRRGGCSGRGGPEMNNLFLIGFMGAGKSSVSAGLGRMLGREVVEMDERIAAREGMSIPELFAQKGEPYFRACETALLKSFAQGAPRIVSCGGGV